ncbi:MAG: virulence RhuM family protein [Bifidobacteriaceae bacterium]|jgi:hypothetical protein|nr:virulence RhuM family protein [Bifidobacteriaceae bacterium]
MTPTDDCGAKLIRNSTAEFLIFTAQAGAELIEARFQDQTVWLTQPLMAELFGTTQQNISQHLHSVYGDGELDEEATHKDFLSVRQEGDRQVRRTVGYYNLDAIISVGYRVNSRRATQFRQWATAARLDAYLDVAMRAVLRDEGRVSMNQAQAHALSEWERYRVVQDQLFASDFDRFLADGDLDGLVKEIEGDASDG